MANGDPVSGSYTAALQQVLAQLNRLDGKLDAYDARLRGLEEQQAAWRELVKSSNAEGELWKDKIKDLEKRVQSQENKDEAGSLFRRYWWALVLVLLPVLANTIGTIVQISGPPTP